MKTNPSSDPHPDLAELDALRTGEASPETCAHVESCPECRAVLGELDALAKTLQATDRPPVTVPKNVDAAVQTVIDERTREIRERIAWVTLVRSVFRSPAKLTLLAGIVVLSAWLLIKAPASPRLAEDIDRSGTVDIVDAYLMSRRLGMNEAPPRKWDFNRDGRVDERDVDLVARKAVAIGKEGV